MPMIHSRRRKSGGPEKAREEQGGQQVAGKTQPSGHQVGAQAYDGGREHQPDRGDCGVDEQQEVAELHGDRTDVRVDLVRHFIESD